MSEQPQESEQEPDVPDHEGEAEPRSDYAPAEAEDSGLSDEDGV